MLPLHLCPFLFYLVNTDEQYVGLFLALTETFEYYMEDTDDTVESVCDSPFLSYLCLFRDGGLKRAKVKDAFKEEQQNLYSKVLLGEQDEGDQGDDQHLEDENPEEDERNQDPTKEQ